LLRRNKRQDKIQTTGIIIIDNGTFWEFRREDTNNFVRLRLSKSSEYIINLTQGDFVTRDYIIGDGSLNNIDIYQK
jgi:hypothetical protein